MSVDIVLSHDRIFFLRRSRTCVWDKPDSAWHALEQVAMKVELMWCYRDRLVPYCGGTRILLEPVDDHAGTRAGCMIVYAGKQIAVTVELVLLHGRGLLMRCVCERLLLVLVDDRAGSGVGCLDRNAGEQIAVFVHATKVRGMCTAHFMYIPG